MTESAVDVHHDPMSFREFVALIASLMAINAVAVDIMLPALPNIAGSLGAQHPNDQQGIVVFYLLGLGISQLFYGPITDRFGRRPVLIGGLAAFAIAGIIPVLTTEFHHLLIARLVQGVGAGAPRVVALSIVRDCYSGDRMGRVMSLAMMVFMIAPIIAPAAGQGILSIASWHWTLGVVSLFAVVLILWTTLRLPETLAPAHRRPLKRRTILGGYWIAATHRTTAGYMVAMGLVMGSLIAFLSSGQQVLVGQFGVGEAFPFYFAVIAIAMSAAAFLNSVLIMRFGLRNVSHLALLGFVLINAVHALVAALGAESLSSYMVLQAMTLFLFGLLGANFSSLAMEPMAKLAGTASSMVGFVSTTSASLLGFAVAQHYDGTMTPIAVGNFVLAVCALAIVFWTERGRLGSPVT